MKLSGLYEKIGYKKLMILSLLLLVVCIVSLLWNYQTKGEFFAKGIDLQGGTQLAIDTNQKVDAAELEARLKPIFGDVSVRTTISVGSNSILIKANENVEKEKLLEEVKNYGIDVSSYSFQKIEASLGESFFIQSRTAVIIAFIFMAFTVFFIFRSFVPSVAVILCAFSDIVSTIAVMNWIGASFSLASFAALLLIIGYSVDTDILLTTKLIKRKEDSILNRSFAAFKTGITMTTTTLVALLALYLISGATAIGDIATILIIALLLDMPYTWITNMGIVRWWMEKKGLE